MYAGAVAALIEAENRDRDAYYDLEMLGYQAEMKAQLDDQVPALRKQVVDELCGDGFTEELCEGVTEAVVQQALEVAFAAALAEALVPLRAAVERTHAQFWMRKTTRTGEWIEVRGSDDSLVWAKKP